MTKRDVQEAASSSGEDNEEDIPIRRSQAPRKSALADSDDEAEVVPAQKPAAPAAEPEAASRRPAKRNTVLDEASDSEDEWDAPKQAAGAHAASLSSCERPYVSPPCVLAPSCHHCWKRTALHAFKRGWTCPQNPWGPCMKGGMLLYR